MAENICEIMKIIKLFPSIISDEINIDLEAEVSKEEMKAVLNSKKLKIVYPMDGQLNF